VCHYTSEMVSSMLCSLHMRVVYFLYHNLLCGNDSRKIGCATFDFNASATANIFSLFFFCLILIFVKSHCCEISQLSILSE